MSFDIEKYIRGLLLEGAVTIVIWVVLVCGVWKLIEICVNLFRLLNS